MARHVFAALLALLLTACATSPNQRSDDFALDGYWSGSMPMADNAKEQLQLQLELQGTRARVWVFSDGAWVEAKPGKFSVQRFMSNAVISSTDAGQDSDGVWVETWVLAVTPVSLNELRVAWSRLVNNIGLEGPDATFSVQASGIVDRTSNGASNYSLKRTNQSLRD